MKSRTQVFAALALLCVAASILSAESFRVSGVYSNLRYNDESGDLSGMELLIVPSGGGATVTYSVFVQISEGQAPYTALVPLQAVGNRIEFTLPAGGAYDRHHFVGTLSKSELTVQWNHGTVEKLKRGRSYWQ